MDRDDGLDAARGILNALALAALFVGGALGYLLS